MTTSPSYAERRKQALREEIIEAAFEIFAERGYHDTGIADIAAKVGIGNSTFYRQFESKQEILEQVFNTTINRAFATLAAENAPEAVNTLAEYRAQVERIAFALDSVARDVRGVRLLLVESLSSGTDLEGRIFGVIELATTVATKYLDHGKEAGYLRDDLDSTAASRAVIGLIVGNMYIGLNPQMDEAARTASIKAAVAVLLDGITR